MFITIGVYTPLYSFSLFLPTIVANLGYTENTAQLYVSTEFLPKDWCRYSRANSTCCSMTVPPYVVACFFCIGAGFLADRWGTRGIFMIVFNIVAIIGFVMQIATSNHAVKYAGTFFAASGVCLNIRTEEKTP